MTTSPKRSLLWALSLLGSLALAAPTADAGPSKVARGAASARKSKKTSAATATIPVSAPSTTPDAMALIESRARVSSEIPGIRQKSAKRPDYVETEKFEVERLPHAVVERVINAGLDDLAACYERFGAADGGNFTLDLTIEPSGIVSAAKLSSDDAGASKKLASCMARSARTWTFPGADGETVVSYPLAFASN